MKEAIISDILIDIQDNRRGALLALVLVMKNELLEFGTLGQAYNGLLRILKKYPGFTNETIKYHSFRIHYLKINKQQSSSIENNLNNVLQKTEGKDIYNTAKTPSELYNLKNASGLPIVKKKLIQSFKEL